MGFVFTWGDQKKAEELTVQGNKETNYPGKCGPKGGVADQIDKSDTSNQGETEGNAEIRD